MVQESNSFQKLSQEARNNQAHIKSLLTHYFWGLFLTYSFSHIFQLKKLIANIKNLLAHSYYLICNNYSIKLLTNMHLFALNRSESN